MRNLKRTGSPKRSLSIDTASATSLWPVGREHIRESTCKNIVGKWASGGVGREYKRARTCSISCGVWKCKKFLSKIIVGQLGNFNILSSLGSENDVCEVTAEEIHQPQLTG